MKKKAIKLIFVIVLFITAGFFIYKGIAGPMKINTQESPNRLTSGLAGYWTFDGQDTSWATNTTNDRSGQGNNGTMTSMSTTTSPAEGVMGQAMNFDGSNDYILSTLTLDPSSTANWSVSLWFKIDQLASVRAANHTIYAQQDGSGTGKTWIQIRSSDDQIVGINNVLSGVYANKVNNWYHVILIKTDSTTSRWYVNGVEGNTNTSTFVSADGGHIIGVKNFVTNFIDGQIDEVRVYNRALSASEVSELYKAGR